MYFTLLAQRVSHWRTLRQMWKLPLKPEGRLVLSVRGRTKKSSTHYFLTLTYSDEHVPNLTKQCVDPLILNHYGPLLSLEKKHVQDFTKRLRKEHAKHSDETIRYYTVGEYGSKTARPHYHSIMFNLSAPTVYQVAQIWGMGNVKVDPVTPASIRYVTKYLINKDYEATHRQRPFNFISNRSGGVGKSYLTLESYLYHKSGLKPYISLPTGAIRLPRYFKDKIFSASDKDILTANALYEGARRYHEEYNRLVPLVADVSKYMAEQEIFHEQNTKTKANRNDTF